MGYDKRMIGFRIMQQRKEKHLTQERLSEKLGISKNHLSSIERGKYLPTTALLYDICSVLGKSPDYYLMGKPTENSNDMLKMLATLPEGHQQLIYDMVKIYCTEIPNL